jgi:alpha-1,3-rhamnosyl/mannosyltransferase
MHVVIDGRMVSNTGIGRWLENIVAHLLRVNSGHRITVLVNPESERLRGFDGATRRLPRRAPIYSLREQWVLPLELRRCRPDLAHFPNFNVPLAARAPYVLTLCDIIYYCDPAACPSRLAHRYARAMIALAARRARKILTISEYSKREIVRHLGLPAEKVAVVYPAVRADRFRTGMPSVEIEAAKQKFGIHRPYIFYTGNHEPRKNLPALIRAFRSLATRRRWQLVLGGRLDPRRQSLYDEAADLIAGGDLRLCGEIPEADLSLLYAGASVFVFPSSCEGFGLPPLEAMACGAPVICADSTSLPEVVGDAALLVPPGDPNALTVALDRVLSSPGLREELRDKGLARARRFSWDRAALEVLALYEQALSG